MDPDVLFQMITCPHFTEKHATYTHVYRCTHIQIGLLLLFALQKWVSQYGWIMLSSVDYHSLSLFIYIFAATKSTAINIWIHISQLTGGFFSVGFQPSRGIAWPRVFVLLSLTKHCQIASEEAIPICSVTCDISNTFPDIPTIVLLSLLKTFASLIDLKW
jgi:hypothetical protein